MTLPSRPTPEQTALALAYERRFRTALGGTTEPFTFAFGARLIAWLATPEGKAAFQDAYRETHPGTPRAGE